MSKRLWLAKHRRTLPLPYSPTPEESAHCSYITRGWGSIHLCAKFSSSGRPCSAKDEALQRELNTFHGQLLHATPSTLVSAAVLGTVGRFRPWYQVHLGLYSDSLMMCEALLWWGYIDEYSTKMSFLFSVSKFRENTVKNAFSWHFIYS